MTEAENFNITDWYTAKEAADRLSRESGREVDISYPRKLAQYGKIRSYKISDRVSMYLKADVDAYHVEARGEKAARAQRLRAKPKRSKKASDKKNAA